MDTLILKYKLDLIRIFHLLGGDIALLESTEPLNLLALSRLFEKIPGVRYATPEGWGGDGDDIEAITETTSIQLIFSVGWGDCPSGCIHRHFWQYRVNSNGKVQFLRSYGDPITFSL